MANLLQSGLLSENHTPNEYAVVFDLLPIRCNFLEIPQMMVQLYIHLTNKNNKYIRNVIKGLLFLRADIFMENWTAIQYG